MKRLALLAFGLGLATWLTGCCCCGQNLGCGGGCGGGCASGACGAPVYHGGGCSSGACGM